MQMGRWFGYRRGYELIPRIWMTIRTKEQFGFIAEMDQKLRDEIKEMSTLGMSPRECGPKIMTSPATVSLQIVSNNKRQQATNAEYAFKYVNNIVYNGRLLAQTGKTEKENRFSAVAGNRL